MADSPESMQRQISEVCEMLDKVMDFFIVYKGDEECIANIPRPAASRLRGTLDKLFRVVARTDVVKSEIAQFVKEQYSDL